MSKVVGSNRGHARYRVPGRIEGWIGRVVEGVLLGAVVVFFAGAALLGLLAGVLSLARNVMPAAKGGAVDFIRAFGQPVVADLLFEALGGAAVGALIGVLRFGRRVKSRRVEEVVDAVATRDVVSAARLGIAYAVEHAVVGALAGILVGWLGLPLPKLLAGEVETVLAHATPVVAWIVGGGAGGPPEGAVFLGLLVIALFVAVIALFIGAAVSLGVGVVARAMALGAAGTVGKAFGIAFILTLTRLGAQAQSLRKRPPQTRAPERAARIEATDDRVWLKMVASEVFSRGWVTRTFAQGAFAGAITGGFQALLAGMLLLLRR